MRHTTSSRIQIPQIWNSVLEFTVTKARLQHAPWGSGYTPITLICAEIVCLKYSRDDTVEVLYDNVGEWEKLYTVPRESSLRACSGKKNSVTSCAVGPQHPTCMGVGMLDIG